MALPLEFIARIRWTQLASPSVNGTLFKKVLFFSAHQVYFATTGIDIIVAAHVRITFTLNI